MATAHYAETQQSAVATELQIDLSCKAANNRMPQEELVDGFIQHPIDFPITYKRSHPFTFNRQQAWRTEPGTLGLTFAVEKYIKPGSLLEINISLRDETQTFFGKVVLVRNKIDHFEIGVWFNTRADAHRVRIVEQICHIESYLRQKRHREGPFISREKAAQEWVEKFAASFPSL